MLHVKYKVLNNRNCFYALPTNYQRQTKKHTPKTDLFLVYVANVNKNMTQALFILL